MKDNTLKIAIIGIIILLIGSSVVPSIGGNIGEMNTVVKDVVDSFEIEKPGSDQQSNMRTSGGNNLWGVTEVVSIESTESTGEPSMAVGPDGTVHLAWVDGYPIYDILYKMKPVGTSWDDNPTEAIATACVSQYVVRRDISLAVDSDGTVHVAWGEMTDTSHGIFYKKKPVDTSWAANPTEFVSTESYWMSSYPSLAVDTGGTVHCAWVDYYPSESGWREDIVYKIKPVGTSWAANPTELVSLETNEINWSEYPSLAVDMNGRVHVAWFAINSEYRGGGSDYDIFYNRRSSGGSWGSTEVVSTDSDGYSFCPSLAVGSDGTVHVAWNDYSTVDIFYKMKPVGTSWAANPTEIVSTESTDLYFTIDDGPSLAVDTGGTVHVAWGFDLTDYDGRGGDFDIFYKNKTIGSSWDDHDTEVVSTESHDFALDPSLAVGPDGIAHVAWADDTNYDGSGLDRDIFYNKRSISWTFMVYMNGDNDLESAVIDDFLEMAEVGSTENVNIVVQLDRHTGYDTFYGDWSDTRRFNITQGMIPTAENATEVLGEVNMGDPAALTDFITWGMENYPASRYCLVLDGPGDGWRGLTFDWTNNDILTTGELGWALWLALDGYDKKLDIVGFDLPYSASTEIAYELWVNDVAGYMIGSEDIIPDDGWPYQGILEMINENPCLDNETLIGGIIDEFLEFYSPRNENCTVSAMNLSRFEPFKVSLSDFAAEFVTEFNEGNEHERYRLKLALATALEHTHTSDPSMVDVWSFADNAEDEFIGSLGALADSLKNSAVELIPLGYSYINDNGGGFSNLVGGFNIYLPLKNLWDYEKNTYLTDTSFATGGVWWNELLDRAASEHSVLYRRNNPGAPPGKWRGTLVKGGWALYDTPPMVFEFMKKYRRTIPWIHGQVAHETEVNATLPQVLVSYDYAGGNFVFTDDTGYFMFPSRLVIDISGAQFQLRVYLVSCTNDTGISYIRVIDSSATPPIIASHNFPFSINSRSDLFLQFDLWSLGGKDRDFAVIYHHTMQSVEVARQVLVLDLDHELPVEVFAYRRDTPHSAYNRLDSTIAISPKDSFYKNANRPDNLEWHEFGHHIMADSLIGGEDDLPVLSVSWSIAVDDNLNGVFNESPPANPEIINGPIQPEGPLSLSYEIVYGEYINPTTCHSWVEGWADFISCVTADIVGDPDPWAYGIVSPVGAKNFELGYQVWDAKKINNVPGTSPTDILYDGEIHAIASILWDLYDSNADSHDRFGLMLNDDIDLTIDEMWDALNNPDMVTLWDVYNAFSYLNAVDSDGDGIHDLDEIFIFHGAFTDIAPFEHYNGIGGGEVIGKAGYARELISLVDVLPDHLWFFDYNDNNQADSDDGNYRNEAVRRDPNLDRPSMPPVNGSYLLLEALDNDTSERIEIVNISAEIICDQPYESYGYHLGGEMNLSELVYFELPSPMFSTRMVISVKDEGYYESDLFTIESVDYYETGLDVERGYFMNHTFYLEPVDTSLLGDFDGDGDVDLDDFGIFAACYGGASAPIPPVCSLWICQADFDDDGDVDLDDFANFATCYSGAANPPNPNCPIGVDADLDDDGDVDLDDFASFTVCYGGSSAPIPPVCPLWICQADLDGDGDVDLDDFATFAQNYTGAR